MTTDGACRATVTSLLRLLAERPPTLGSGRLLCIDGPAGAGKSTLADAVAAATGAPVLHVDDFLEGWSGLSTVHGAVMPVLRALALGQPARWRAWDWARGERGTERVLLPSELLVLEGVGAGQRAWASLTTVLVWVEAAPELRWARALARDGEGLREHWEQWSRDERSLFTADAIRERADLVVET